MARKSRSWFFDSQPDSSGDRFRHKNIPTEETLIHLLDSIPFFNEETDGATITQQGLVKMYPDETVIKDRNTPEHNQPHQYVLTSHQAPGAGVRVGHSYVESTPDVNLNDGAPVDGSGLRVTGVKNTFQVGSGEDITRIGYQFELNFPSLDPRTATSPAPPTNGIPAPPFDPNAPYYLRLPQARTVVAAYDPDWTGVSPTGEINKHHLIKATDLGINVHWAHKGGVETAPRLPFCVMTSLKDLPDPNDPAWSPIKDFDAIAWEGFQYDGNLLHLRAMASEAHGRLFNHAVFKLDVERPPLAHEAFGTVAFGNSLSDASRGQAVSTITARAFEPHHGDYNNGEWGTTLAFANTPSGTTHKVVSFMISVDNTLYVNPESETDTRPTSSFYVNGSEGKMVREVSLNDYVIDSDADGNRDNIILGATGKIGRDINMFIPAPSATYEGRVVEVKNVCETGNPYVLSVSSKSNATIFSHGPTNNYRLTNAGESAKFICSQYNGTYYWFVFTGSADGAGSGGRTMTASANQTDREVTITHNWGTKNVIVQTFATADGASMVSNATRTVNSVTVRLESGAPGTWTAVVQG